MVIKKEFHVTEDKAQRRTELDGLRGVFSLMVVLFHYPENFLPKEVFDFFLIRESNSFVDFFFVLSGFVISYNYNSLSSFQEFWIYLKKRVVRLYPLLFYTVIVYLAFRLFTFYAFPSLIDATENIAAMMINTADSLLFTNSTPILGSTIAMNGPSWSISAEMISYVIFGIICISASKNVRRLLFISITCLSILFLYKQGGLIKTGDYGFLRGLIAFLIGFFVWELSLNEKRIKDYLQYSIPFLILIFLYILHETEETHFGSLFNFTIPFIFGLCILIFIKTKGKITETLNSKPLQFLGKISYSLYLNHFLLVTIFPRLIFQVLKVENLN